MANNDTSQSWSPKERQQLFTKKDLEEGISADGLARAQKLADYLTNEKDDIKNSNLTTNQLRKFFGDVKKLQMKGYSPNEFRLLKPKLAYAVGRAKEGNKIKDFYIVLTKGIDLVDNEKEFKNFIKIFEALVAYHRYEESIKRKS